MYRLTIALAIVAALAACGKRPDTSESAASSRSTESSATTAARNSTTTETPSAPPATTAANSAATTPAAPPPPPATAANTPTTAETTAMGASSDGQSVYTKTCALCHAAGVAGAPKLGDRADWAPRIAQGKDTLYKHALEGFTGKKGQMPPKGGNTALADADVKAAVDYMAAQGK